MTTLAKQHHQQPHSEPHIGTTAEFLRALVTVALWLLACTFVPLWLMG